MSDLSYHGSQALKEERIGIIRGHRAAERLMQGATGTPSLGEKGCAVACTVDGYHHARYPVELGISGAWAYLEDAVFEGLSVAEAQLWPERFLSAVPVGVDLWPAYHRVTGRILLEVALPAAQASGEPPKTLAPVEAAIRQVAGLYEHAAQGRVVSPTFAYWHAWGASMAWSAAESAAESAAWSAAWSAAESAARSAAESAARSAAESAAESAARSAAESAARSAAWSAAWSAARSAAWGKIARIVVEELEASS